MTTTPPSTSEVRQWAIREGIRISGGGPIPYGVVDRWNAAHPDRPATRSKSRHPRPHPRPHPLPREDDPNAPRSDENNPSPYHVNPIWDVTTLTDEQVARARAILTRLDALDVAAALGIEEGAQA